MIACKAKDLPYLEVLLPNDQDLETLDEESFQQKAKEDSIAPPYMERKPDDIINSTIENSEVDGQIDNPYLREIKMPILKGAKKSKYGYLMY